MLENGQKVKLLVIYDLLRKEADYNKPMTRQVLCDRLNELGISSSVRVLSRDIKSLTNSGFDVVSVKVGREVAYYASEIEFDTPELKILIDAVQASSFITEKKTKQLVDKIIASSGISQQDLLKNSVVCFNTRKHTNESILYNVDFLEEAIHLKKKAAFYYFDLDENGNKVYRVKDSGEKKRYYVEPVSLIFNEDNYYLMTYSSRHPETTANYRVDRMDSVEVVDDSCISDAALSKLDGISNYTEEVFKMYNGEQTSVELVFDSKLIGPVFDKFGESISITKVTENVCSTIVNIRVSPVFFGWVFQFGKLMKIKSPMNVIEEYVKLLDETKDNQID